MKNDYKLRASWRKQQAQFQREIKMMKAFAGERFVFPNRNCSKLEVSLSFEVDYRHIDKNYVVHSLILVAT